MAALAITTPLTQNNIEELFTFLKQCRNRAEWLHESNRKLRRNLYPSTAEKLGPILQRQKEDLQFIEPLVEKVSGLMNSLFQAAQFEDNQNLMQDIDQLYFGLEYSGPCSKLKEIPTTENVLTEIVALSEQLSKYKTPEGDFDLYGIDTGLRHQGTPREIEQEEERRREQDEQDDRDDMEISRIRKMYRSMTITQMVDHYNSYSRRWSPGVRSAISKYLS
jgi:hypothetical protein